MRALPKVAPLELDAEGDHVVQKNGDDSLSAAIKSLPTRFSSLRAAVKTLPMRFSVFFSDLASRICLFDLPESGCPRSKCAGVCVAVVRVAARGSRAEYEVPAMPCQRRRTAAEQLSSSAAAAGGSRTAGAYRGRVPRFACVGNSYSILFDVTIE